MIVEQIIQKAMEKADGAQAFMVTQETSGVDFENDKLKSAVSSQRTSIHVKVIRDGKVGVSSTTDPADVDGVVGRALEAAEFGRPAQFELPGPEELTPVKTFDPELIPLQKPEMIGMGQQMMDMIKAYNPEILAGGGVNRVITRIEFTNSKGAVYSEELTDIDVGAGGQWTRGTDILFAGYSVAQRKRELDTEEVAARAIEYFRMAENIVPVQSKPMPVIFTPYGFVAVLLSLALALDGKNVFLGSSPLRDKIGQPIAHPSFTLIDDPTLDYAPNTSAFDNEGVARKRMPLVENGILRNFLYDLDTAARAGGHPTGHGSNRSLTNLVVSPGDTSFEEMLAGISEGLLVHDYLGLGQGNPINGEFSVNLSLGYKIQNGKVTGRVKDVMLAGNAYAALKDITSMSKEREWVSGRWVWFSGLFPYVQVGQLNVTA
ncbi:MAG TPA: TldD/PmbA family protein [Anaerolineales bacterium]|nr:TldD/PmbA family protein [Anaerolineales bacterium]